MRTKLHAHESNRSHFKIHTQLCGDALLSLSCQLNIPVSLSSTRLLETLLHALWNMYLPPLPPPLAPCCSLGTGLSSVAGWEESLDRRFFIPPVRAATEARASAVQPARWWRQCSLPVDPVWAGELFSSSAEVTPEHRAWMNSGIFHKPFPPFCCLDTFMCLCMSLAYRPTLLQLAKN